MQILVSEKSQFNDYLNKKMLNQNEFEIKIQKIKSKSKELVLASTSHGLPNIFRSQHSAIKLMWICLFTASISMGFYIVTKSIIEYLDFETVTKINVINETPTQFPAITIYNLKDEKSNISLSSIMFGCLYSGGACSPDNDFDLIQDKFGYVSYRFKKRASYLSGQSSGLTLIIVNNIEFKTSSNYDGLGVIVHNHSSDPRYNAGSSAEGVFISPRFATNLVIDRVFSSKLSRPYSDCIDETHLTSSSDSDLFRYIIDSTNYTYKQRDCLDYCLGRELNRSFNISSEIDKLSNVIEILTKRFSWSTPYSFEIRYNITKNKSDECIQLCPSECNSISYSVSTSFSSLNVNDQFLNMIKNYFKNSWPVLTLEDIRKNYYYLNIYYSDLKYTNISEKPMSSIFDIVSNIGGILGLFIGISFLSFAEILELLVEILFILFKSPNKVISSTYLKKIIIK